MHSGYVAMTARVIKFVDLTLTCSTCHRNFIFAADEQMSFFERGFHNPPKRCKRCLARRALRKTDALSETRTQCAKCGSPTTVPFVPRQGRPVLCHACFQHHRRPGPTTQESAS